MCQVEYAYQTLATSVGCSGANSLACLRAVPATNILNAMARILSTASDAGPFPRVQDDYFHPILPSAAIRAGWIADVPFITGTYCDLLDIDCLISSNSINRHD